MYMQLYVFVPRGDDIAAKTPQDTKIGTTPQNVTSKQQASSTKISTHVWMTDLSVRTVRIASAMVELVCIHCIQNAENITALCI